MVTETFNLSTLRALEIFAPLRDEELEYLRPAISVRVAHVGDVLMEEGTPGDELYVLLVGECKVIKGHRTPNEAVITALRPVEVLGAMALLSGHPRSATVIATETCRLLILEREGFEEVLIEYPRACLALLRDAHRRVSRLTDQLATLK